MSLLPTPVAIVGVSCRFPGGAHDLARLWQILEEGRNVWSDVPSDRYNWKSFYHPSRESNVAHSHRGGHFLHQDVAAFDAGFFGISSAEAEAMDPQQRIQLEIAYEALENAGITLESVKGSKTGVYVATFTHDYENMMYKDTATIPKYAMTGVGQAIVSNRISYMFDLKGPSLTLDTGCSGSLVALHLACQSLRSGESSLALVGGTNLILTPDTMIPMDILHLLNEGGKCYSFDRRGSGYGRGEGVAMVVLKRLDDALREGDAIRGVIRNTAVGQDGKTSGITLPNGAAQQDLIRSAYQAVMLDPREIGYVEAHGTGTVAGDITEIGAISQTFCEDRSQEKPLYIGSIKGNIGHLESTSGLAGLLKALLVLEKGMIPSTPNLENFKEKLDLTTANIKIPRALESWPAGVARRASINSFGYGGANAHAILEFRIDGCYSMSANASSKNPELPVIENTSHTYDDRTAEHGKPRRKLFTVTAKSEQSLAAALFNLRNWVMARDESGSYITRLAYTLTSRRSLMGWRYAFAASRHDEILDALDSKSLRSTRIANNNRMIFVFTGQGAQWPAMGKDLALSFPLFKKSLVESAATLKGLGASWDLLEELELEEAKSRVHESQIGQPATTAIQIGLVELLRSLGITPHIVLGHSSGEIAAAYTAGAVSKELALALSYHRSFLAKRCKSLLEINGGMLAVGLGEDELHPYLSRLKTGRAMIACCNSPLSTTVSGDEDAIIELKELLQQSATSARRLKVDTAYHSHHMERVSHEYSYDIRGIKATTADASVRFYSSVTAQEKTSDFGSEYWVTNLVSKVRFYEALRHMCQQLYADCESTPASFFHTFMEIGPHTTLLGPVKQTLTHLRLDSFNATCIPALTRYHDSQLTFLHAIGNLFEHGYPVDLARTNSLDDMKGGCAVVTDLTPYSWDHSLSYWHESRLYRNHRLRPHPYHDLLGLRNVGDTMLEPTWRHVLSAETLPWLRDHVVDNCMVFPASGYIAMAVEAKKQITLDRYATGDIRCYVLRDVVFSKILEVPELPGSIEVHLSLRSLEDTLDRKVTAWEGFHVTSVSLDGITSEHCHGRIMVALHSPSSNLDFSRDPEDVFTPNSGVQKLMNTPLTQIDPQSMYKQSEAKGHHWGPNFALIKEFNATDFESSGTVIIEDTAKCMPGSFMQPHVIHPTTLDALIHSSLIMFGRTCDRSLMFPVGIGELTISADIVKGPGEALEFATTINPYNSYSTEMELSAYQVEACFERKLCVQLRRGELQGTMDLQNLSAAPFASRELCYQIDWNVDPTLCNPLHITAPPKLISDDCVSPEEKIEILDHAALRLIDSCICRIARKDVQERHLKYFDWMTRLQKFSPIQNTKDESDGGEIAASLHSVKSVGVEGEALFRIGANLTSILTGRSDPLSLLLDGGLLSRLYAEDSASQQCCLHLINYVKHLVFKNPRMKVLEIGAGTAGLTVPLLQALDGEGRLQLGRYAFTDISSGFFDEAKQKLRQWEKFLHYQTLDIGRDPLQQGFDGGSYDLIVAYNALHVTVSLDDTITNTRKLLKPRGRLVIIEITRFVPYINTIFGVLPGWYMGRSDGRAESPLLTVDQWNSRLLQGSFSGVELSARDYEGPAGRVTMMVSRERSTQSLPNLSGPVYVLLHPNVAASDHRLYRRLQQIYGAKSIQASMRELTAHYAPAESIHVIVDDYESPLFTTSSLDFVRSLLKFIAKAANILLITTLDPFTADSSHGCNILTEAARQIQTENERLRLVTLNVQPSSQMDFLDIEQKISEILRNSFANPKEETHETNYIYKNGLVLVPRLKPDLELRKCVHQATDRQIRPAIFHQGQRVLKLHTEIAGKLDNLHFIDDPLLERPIDPSEIEIKVEAYGVNLEEVLGALGQVKSSRSTICECAGTVVNVGSDIKHLYKLGDRVCGWGRTIFSSRSRVNGSNAHHLPPSMTFTIGASIPVVFLTAYYALVNLAKLSKGETVLIHVASASTGQAAVQIAQSIDATILATVRTVSERKFLMDTFKLPREQILSTTDAKFRRDIERLTKARGVDVLLNSLAEESLEDNWACIGRFGRFVEIGRFHSPTQYPITIGRFEKNVAHFSVDVAALSEHRPQEAGRIMKQVMSMFNDEKLKPIQPLQTMEMTDIEKAFKMVQNKNHVGKIVLNVFPTTVVNYAPKAVSPIKLCNEGTYILAGHLGALGLDICSFMASRGAKHVALIAWDVASFEQHRTLSQALQQSGISLQTVALEDSNQMSSDELTSRHLYDCPPVRGIVQADLRPQGCLSDSSELDESAATLLSKGQGTRGLQNASKHWNLDFFVILSSSRGILRSQSCMTYAYGNAPQSPMSTTQETCSSKCVTLELGGMKDSILLAQSFESEKTLSAEGLVPMMAVELEALLEYSMTVEANSCPSRHIVSGFDRDSITGSENHRVLNRPLLSHLTQSDIGHEDQLIVASSQIVDENIVDAKSRQEASRIVISALQQKISTLVAIEQNMIDLNTPIEEFGLDSLIMWGLRNWIFGNFRADLDPTEISDARSTATLASTILDRSKFKTQGLNHNEQGTHDASNNETRKRYQSTPEFPRQPLPRLQDTLQAYLDALRPHSSDEDFECTSVAVARYQEPGGIGEKLQDRLAQREADPQVESWLWDIYTARRYLRLRTPLIASQSYFGTHPFGQKPHGQAERATVISLATLQFKQDMEMGKLAGHHSSLSGQIVDPASYQWLFHACREPHVGEDQIHKYPSEDYIVVLRYGHAFKIVLKGEPAKTPFKRLKAVYESIIASTPKEMSWITALTANERDRWAKTREDLLQISKDNKASVQIIQSSAFIVCLDDVEPESSVERCHQFLYGDGSNRWYDKTLQFVVCRNGVSASICEHSALDGIAVEPLHEYINREIGAFDTKSYSAEEIEGEFSPDVEQLPMLTNKVIDDSIRQVRQEIRAISSNFTFASIEVSSLGLDFLRSHKCPIQSGIQLAIQLACRRFFGYNPPALETVSMAHFRKGRVEVHHIIGPAMAAFLKAAGDSTAPNHTFRVLFFEAAKAHAKSLSRAAKGRAFSRHILAMEWMLREGEVTPELFEDPSYIKMKPGKVMTSNFTTGWLEGGFVYPIPKSILIYFQVKHKSVSYSIFGNSVDANTFRELLKAATLECYEILN